MVYPVYMTITKTRTPAIASACETVFVIAATVRNIADIVKRTNTVKRKKVKNCDAVGLRPARKYSMTLNNVAIISFTGASDITPAKASAAGWQYLLQVS